MKGISYDSSNIDKKIRNRKLLVSVVLIVALITATVAGTYAWFNLEEPKEEWPYAINTGSGLIIVFEENTGDREGLLQPAVAKADALSHNQLGNPYYLEKAATEVTYESYFIVYSGNFEPVTININTSAKIKDTENARDLVANAELEADIEIWNLDEQIASINNLGQFTVTPEVRIKIKVTLRLVRWDIVTASDLRNAGLEVSLNLKIEDEI